MMASSWSFIGGDGGGGALPGGYGPGGGLGGRGGDSGASMLPSGGPSMLPSMAGGIKGASGGGPALECTVGKSQAGAAPAGPASEPTADEAKAGELASYTAEKVNELQQGLSKKFAELVQAFFQMAGGFGVGFYFSWELSLVILATTPLLGFATMMLVKTV